MTHDSAPVADTSHTSHSADTFTDTSFHHNHSNFNDHSHHHSHHQDDHHHHGHHSHHKHHHHYHRPDEDLPDGEPSYPPPAYGTVWHGNDSRREYYTPPVGGNMTDVRQLGGRIFVAVFFVVWVGMFIFIMSKFVQALSWDSQNPGFGG